MPTDPAPLQDALLRTAETHGPGLVGLVTEHGEPVFEGAVGVTDLADGRPPTADLHDVLTSDAPFVAAALAGG